jgi:ubiquinone/menaquinone biosynthesis C-methylase UbiE
MDTATRYHRIMAEKLGLQRSQWEQLACTDPLWAVLTDPARKNGGWNVDEFFATGAHEIAAVMADAERLGFPTGRSTALDFGCGVGRLSQALAQYFDRVTGVDIAPSMIEQAGRHNRRPDRCSYLLNTEDNLAVLSENSFDLVLSNITLQHMPPRYIRRYLREFVRVLRPGGLLVFQLPDSYRRAHVGVTSSIYTFVTRRILRMPTVMEMYGIRRSRVERLLEERGARMLHIEEDRAAGECWLGYRYFATK